MDLGDVNVKKFGKEGDFLLKLSKKKIIINLFQKLKKIFQKFKFRSKL